MRIIKKALILICIGIATNAFALTQHEKLWLGISASRNLTNDGKWRYLIFSQARYIDESQPWQSLILEGGIGNVLNNYVTIWAGYRLTERNPANGFNPENRLFQQVIAKYNLANNNELVYRARLEESIIRQSSNTSIRLRHRIAFSHNQPIAFQLEPFFYEEIFMQLQRTNFTPNYFITENRIFLGFNWLRENKQWIEIGYINQFQMRQANQKQNMMSHVISATYNI